MEGRDEADKGASQQTLTQVTSEACIVLLLVYAETAESCLVLFFGKTHIKDNLSFTC